MGKDKILQNESYQSTWVNPKKNSQTPPQPPNKPDKAKKASKWRPKSKKIKSQKTNNLMKEKLLVYMGNPDKTSHIQPQPYK